MHVCKCVCVPANENVKFELRLFACTDLKHNVKMALFLCMPQSLIEKDKRMVHVNKNFGSYFFIVCECVRVYVCSAPKIVAFAWKITVFSQKILWNNEFISVLSACFHLTAAASKIYVLQLNKTKQNYSILITHIQFARSSWANQLIQCNSIIIICHEFSISKMHTFSSVFSVLPDSEICLLLYTFQNALNQFVFSQFLK